MENSKKVPREFKESAKRIQRKCQENSKRVPREFKESAKRVQREFMENTKKKVKKSVSNETKESKTVSGLTNEEEIQKTLDYFETERRKQFEETLTLQKQVFEKRLRGEIPTIRLDNKKNYDISFCLFSSRIKERPIWGYRLDVTGDLNEFSLANQFDEMIKDYFNSDKYRQIQKKAYYQLRTKGVEPAEIYPQIELRYLMMDGKEKRNFRSMLRADYTRKKAKQKGNENDDSLPPAE